MARGTLIAIEGPKGIGKTSLIEHLRGSCDGDDRWYFTKEPTDAFDLENEGRLRGTALAQALNADRRRHLDREVAPALADGKIVVIDRYLLSFYVFQTVDGVPAEDLHNMIADMPRPDVSILLLCSPNTLADRRRARSKPTRLEVLLEPNREILAYLQHQARPDLYKNDVFVYLNENMNDLATNTQRIRQLTDVRIA